MARCNGLAWEAGILAGAGPHIRARSRALGGPIRGLPGDAMVDAWRGLMSCRTTCGAWWGRKIAYLQTADHSLPGVGKFNLTFSGRIRASGFRTEPAGKHLLTLIEGARVDAPLPAVQG